MTVLGEKLQAAINAKNNDISKFVWKFAKKRDGSQESIKLVDATEGQLRDFYAHCNSMLYSADKFNPGRYTLLKIIEEQKRKCSVELYLRKIEAGELGEKDATPRYIYLDGLLTFMNNNIETFPRDKRNNIPISAATGGLPKEFANLPIGDIIDGCLKEMGLFIAKHITHSFIYELGVWPSKEEVKELRAKYDKGDKKLEVIDLVREGIGMRATAPIVVKPSGLPYNEFRAMLRLRSIEYYNMTTEQLQTLRKKVLFKLENEIHRHITSWEKRKEEIRKVADSKGINLENLHKNDER